MQCNDWQIGSGSRLLRRWQREPDRGEWEKEAVLVALRHSLALNVREIWAEAIICGQNVWLWWTQSLKHNFLLNKFCSTVPLLVLMTWDSQDNNSTEVQYFWIAWIELWLLISLLSSGSTGTLNSSSMTRHATGMSRRVIVNHGRGSMAWEGATRRMLPKWPCHFKIRCRSSRCQTQGTTRRSHWRDMPGRTTRSTGQALTDCWNWTLFPAPSSDPHHHFRCHWHNAFGESGQNLECFEDRMSPKICQSWAWERRAWASSLAWLNSSWSQEFTGSTSFLNFFEHFVQGWRRGCNGWDSAHGRQKVWQDPSDCQWTHKCRVTEDSGEYFGSGDDQSGIMCSKY